MNTTDSNTANTADSNTDRAGGLEPSDPRWIFGHAVGTATATISRVCPEQFGLTTPCEEYDVRALIGHLVTVLDRVAALGDGTDPMAFPLVVTGIADDGWTDRWLAGAHEVQRAWADSATLERMMTLPWAQQPGARMLAMYTNEVSVHTWDLAVATGQQPVWNEAVLAVAFAAIQAAMPAGGRRERFEEMTRNAPMGRLISQPPYGEALDAAADAPLIDRLVAWNGRDPQLLR
jgi:uncharacterized protein (TIGR03086 family)